MAPINDYIPKPGAEAEDWLHAETEVMERVRKAFTDKERI